MPYTKEQRALAKKEGLHLITLEVDSRLAKTPGGCATVTAACGPKTAKRVHALIQSLADVRKRIE